MYVRITRFRPHREWRDEVIKTLDSYMGWLKVQPGFVVGMRHFPLHQPEEVARLTVWKERSFADHVATMEHALATRSHLLAMTVDQAIHEEELDESPTYVPEAGAYHEPSGIVRTETITLEQMEKAEEATYERVYPLTSLGEEPHTD